MIKVNEFAFIGYPTTDKPRAQAFYEDLLGVQPSMNMDIDDGHYWIEYEVGANTIGLSNYWKPSGAPQMGPIAGLEVENFDATIARLKAKGVTFTEEVVSSSVCRMSCALDPDGNGIWIHKRNPDRGAYTGPDIPFISYPATERKRADDFYAGIFGLVRPHKDYEAEGDFWSEYDVGTGTLALCNGWKPSSEPSMGPAMAFEVENFETAVAELKAKGIPFPMEPMETQVCFMGVVTDPDGNSLFIHKRKPGHG